MELKEITIEEWAQLVSQFPEASLFHTKEWLEVLIGSYSSIDVRLFKLIDDQRSMIGLIPIESSKKGPIKISGSPLPRLITPYQGPLFVLPVSNRVHELIRLIVKYLGFHYFHVSFPPNVGYQVVQNSGSKWRIRKTIIIDLAAGKEKLWSKMKAETRNQIRQAERRGIQIFEPESIDEWLSDYYHMVEAVYSRQKMDPPVGSIFYKKLWEMLYGKNMLKVFLAKYNGKTIAGGIFPTHKNHIYFLDGASFREYQKLRANNLIQWHVISWGADQGLRFYDMAGANIPSIAHFKKGFGGDEVNYSCVQMIKGFLGNTSYQLYQLYRSIKGIFGQ